MTSRTKTMARQGGKAGDPVRKRGAAPAAPAVTAAATAREELHQGLPLDDFFPYLVNLITQTIAVHFQKTARPLGVTIERWRVLFVLLKSGAMRASRLSARTGIEASTLSHLLTRMVREGLVTKRKDAGDGRAVCIELTDDGLALAERILPLALQYEDVALAGMSPTEAKRLKTTLRLIADRLQTLDDVIVPPARPEAGGGGTPAGSEKPS